MNRRGLFVRGDPWLPMLGGTATVFVVSEIGKQSHSGCVGDDRLIPV